MAIIAYSAVIAALLLCPEICADSAKEALSVWGLHIVPSLFPYMLFTRLLSSQIQKTRFSPFAVCAVLGISGGSPAGAACIGAYHASFSKKSVLTLFALTGIISPMFFLGTVKSFTGDTLFCLRLLLSQWIGAALSALCVCFLPFTSSKSQGQKVSPHSTENALTQSIDAMLHVGGLIICFSVLAGMLRPLPLPETLRSLLHALLEISGGTHALLHSPCLPVVRSILLAFACGFGGFSILFQNQQFLAPTGTKLRILFFIALLRGLLSAAAMRVLLPF